MKVSRVGFITLLLSASFLITNDSPRVSSSVKANSEVNSKTGLPSFLEKGKTYYFYFAFSTGDGTPSLMQPSSITGRVEKLDVDAGWVYINQYVAERKGKVYQYKFQGYTWINMSQVYLCSEMIPSP